MTAEERFEKIERDLAVVAHVHSLNQQTLSDLMKTVGGYIDSSPARMTRIEDALAQTNDLVARFVQSAYIRMRRIEDNLDALIRAITAEHTNGKKRA
jgi:hypothetical protein